MLEIPMMWIIIGFVVLIVGAIALLRMPVLMATPFGAIVLIVWLIIVVAIFEYARVYDPWPDSIIITLGELLTVLGGLYSLFNSRLKKLERKVNGIYGKIEKEFDKIDKAINRRFEDYRAYQDQLFNQYTKNLDEKVRQLAKND